MRRYFEKMDDVEMLAEQQVMSIRFPTIERAGKTVLEVDGLEKSYGDHQVLKGVDLRVSRGDRIALLGVNGACLVGHGRSNARAIRNAIRFADSYAASGVIETIGDTIGHVLESSSPGEN